MKNYAEEHYLNIFPMEWTKPNIHEHTEKKLDEDIIIEKDVQKIEFDCDSRESKFEFKPEHIDVNKDKRKINISEITINDKDKIFLDHNFDQYKIQKNDN